MSCNNTKENIEKAIGREIEPRIEWSLPNGYIFVDENNNPIQAIRVTLRKMYPETIDECMEILGLTCSSVNCGHKGTLLAYFQALLICRDAYWKIAEWKPNYNSGADKFGIICMNGVVQESNPATNWERHLNKVLDFPTKMMRDAFAKNFKTLIETCKELI